MTYSIKVELPHASTTLLDITDDMTGYSRERRNGSEVFLDEEGELIEDESILDRLVGLSIPPAWETVWICAHDDGYLQCTGRDAQGRKQYIYHALWHEYRAAQKYERVLDFARALPDLRAQLDVDLRQRSLSRERASALGTAIIDRTAMRVGHELYTKAHGSHGLTTLYKSHCERGTTRADFEFPGKSGVQRHVTLRSRRLCSQLDKFMALPGDYLFQYHGTSGVSRLHAEHINAYIARACGEHTSAKYFRTWHGSLRAFESLLNGPCDQIEGDKEDHEVMAAREARIKLAISDASTFLGNTKAVCRDHYIHSALLDAARDGTLWTHAADRSKAFKGSTRPTEELLIDLLEHAP